MPEGPSIVILREQAAAFAGRTIRKAEGNAKIDMDRLPGHCVRAVRSFGKQFLMQLSGELTVRVHLLMFGSYRMNERRDMAPRLRLVFDEGEINFYNGSVRLLEGDLDTLFDWRGDVMSEQWDPALARARLRKMPQTLVCDALLDQDVFAGVGNIRTRCCSVRASTRSHSWVRFLPTSCGSWWSSPAFTRSSSWPGRRHTFWRSTGWCTTAVAARAMAAR